MDHFTDLHEKAANFRNAEALDSTVQKFHTLLPVFSLWTHHWLLWEPAVGAREKITREPLIQLLLCRSNPRLTDLLDGEELAGIEIHSHIDPSKSTAPYQLTLSPTDRRCIFDRWQSPDRRLREEPDSRFSDACANFLDQTAKSPIFPSAAQIPKIQRLTNRPKQFLHQLELGVSEWWVFGGSLELTVHWSWGCAKSVVHRGRENLKGGNVNEELFSKTKKQEKSWNKCH